MKEGNRDIQQFVFEVLSVDTKWKNLTEAQKHKCLWTWLSLNPQVFKQAFWSFFNLNKELKPKDNCYACTVAYQRSGRDDSNLCRYCPIRWVSAYNNNCVCYAGEYHQWSIAKDPNVRSSIAKIIAEKEWHDERRN